MAIVVNIDVMLAKRKMSVTELSDRVGITMENISILKNGKAKAIKVETLNKICQALECQPGDIFRRLGSASLFYAVIYTFCLYQNLNGITSPLWAAELLEEL